MATGFETMKSTYTALLFPPVDPTDKYDPTFLGIKRKRRIPEPERDTIVFRDAGKHIDRSKMSHDTECFAQLGDMCREETFHGDLRSTRFGIGFQRRHASAIGVESLRQAEQEFRTQRAENLLAARRLANGATQKTEISYVLSAEKPSCLPAPVATLPTHRAVSLLNRQSHLFQSPVTSSNTIAASHGRRERLIREGLTATKKDWSVREQLTALDGYNLPSIRR